MRTSTIYLIFLAFCVSAPMAGSAEYPCRWVYVARGLHKDEDVEEIGQIVRTASQHGLNGMVLAAGLDGLDRQPETYFKRLEEVKRLCAEHRVEIIPIVFSAGYGGRVLGHNRNLAAGLPVEDARFLVEGDFTGSWNYVPKELGIVCWYYENRNESLKHFSDLGFKTLAGAYYDGDTLENPEGWLEALEHTPGALGIMYTS